MSFTLKDVRNQFGFTQEEVANRAGITLSAISAMEKIGSVPTKATCKKMAKAYGVSAFILRTIAVLGAEPVPDAGLNRELYLEIQSGCRYIIDRRAQNKKTK